MDRPSRRSMKQRPLQPHERCLHAFPAVNKRDVLGRMLGIASQLPGGQKIAAEFTEVGMLSLCESITHAMQALAQAKAADMTEASE